MTTVGRLKDGDLLLIGEVNERLPVIQDGLVAHYPFDDTVKRYIPNQIRYIRDFLGNGSTANTSNHWIELQAFDENGVNVALNKIAINSAGTSIPNWVDGNTDTGQWTITGMSGGSYHTVDLGDFYDITTIKHWHYWGDGRRYYKTRVAVSQDGVHWFDVFDSSIEGEYKESSAGHTINLRSNGTILPSANLNTTLTDKYIAVEESTTNSWSGEFNIYNNHRQPATLKTLSETYMGQPVYRLGFTVTDETKLSDFRTNLFNHGVYGGSQSWVQDTKYVSSIYWRPVNKKDTVFGGIASNMGGWMSGKTDYLEDGWRRYYRYRTGVGIATRSDSIHHSFYCPSLQLNETIYIDVCCPQTEEGRVFPTSYTKGSRSDGRIDVPFKLKPPYTINLWHKGIKPLSEVIDQSTSPMIFQLNDYHSNASISFWNYVKSLKIYIKSDLAAGWTSTISHFTYSNETWDNKEHMYTLVAIDNRTFKVYMDGEYLGQQTSSEDVTNITYLSMGNISQPNAQYHDVSLYDKALNEIEVKKLYGQFSITKEGALITKKITEKPNNIPEDALYIPLDFNSSDRLNLISSSSESNIIRDNGSTWVGGTSELEFNFNRDYGMNWAGDWSIVYWKNPIGTHTNNLNGYNIESIGSNGNTVGGGYMWFGKNNSSNTIKLNASTENSSVFSPSDYFNQWSMISLVKSGSTVTYTHRSKNIGIYTATAIVNTSVSNYYVTQHGYDFKMGGWDNGNPTNTYFKNLIVAKRAFTVDELNALYNTQMRAYPNSFQIQHSFKEGYII